jgi:cytochrome c peroxidase
MKSFTEIHWMLAICAVLVLLFLGLALWQGTQYQTVAAMTSLSEPGDVVNEPIQPIPLHIDLEPGKVALGKRLFHEPLLSANNTLSCASCHVLNSGGVDHQQHALGINGADDPINTPTVFNSAFNFRQFWNGRAATLNAQIPGPIMNPLEMGSNWPDILMKLNASKDYVTEFAAIYRDGITPDNIVDSIAMFERSLYTPNSRFDQYLRGDTKAITADELKGYNLFKTYGCASCHQGMNVGGNMYQRMGIVSDYFADRGNITPVDLGLYNITGQEDDRYVFKVPSLRMVALTAPYFHDGSVKTLENAVALMAYYQLGRTISQEDVNLIVQFLRTLPGEHVELTAKN